MVDETPKPERASHGTNPAIRSSSPLPGEPAREDIGVDVTYVPSDLREPIAPFEAIAASEHNATSEPVARPERAALAERAVVPEPVVTSISRPIISRERPSSAAAHAASVAPALGARAYGLGLVLGIGFGIVTSFFSFALALELLIYGALGVGVTHLIRLRLERRLHIRRALFALLRND
ncbi:MAG: hypothetical protein IPK13_26905 [Deltaproteobacteria bacterium]|nr:hypothetical protein [Deltaproteobacteria bacterium]